MSDNTQSISDLNRESRTLMQGLAKKHPELMKSFQGLHHASLGGEALDTKTKELIALALGIGTHCQRCIGLHLAAALKAGATEEEVVETIAVSTMMGGGPSLMYGLDALKALEELKS